MQVAALLVALIPTPRWMCCLSFDVLRVAVITKLFAQMFGCTGQQSLHASNCGCSKPYEWVPYLLLKQLYSIVLYLNVQVFLAFEWLVDNVNPRFILKTDDDAYVDSGNMVTALRELCQNPNCTDERCDL